MSVLASVQSAAVNAAASLDIAAAVGDPYTPATMGADLAAGAVTILPWVGAGVGAGVGIAFIFVGINKGFGFFWKMVGKR
jgi:hypothetical protein